jgi:squalene-hopene/tetraprenyl-beta-curcumene cyclase
VNGSPQLAEQNRRAAQTYPRLEFSSPPTSTLERARRALLSRQYPDGHWVGELQGDTILESEYILLKAFLGREGDPDVAQCARYILSQELPDGGWSNCPDGPPDISVSVKAYFALKLAGYDQAEPFMRRACDVIRGLGGAENCNSFAKFYLALLGQIPYRNCAAVPPEMILLPRWAYFNIYAMSSWTRTIVIPLTIFYAHKPVRQIPERLNIRELFLQEPHMPRWPHPPTRRFFSWTNAFLAIDWIMKLFDPWKKGRGPAAPRAQRPPVWLWPFALIRLLAVRKATAWLFEHFSESDGVGAIFPPMIYTVICLRCLGYTDDAPEMLWALEQLDRLKIEEDGAMRLQPCFSPVWDTALTLIALSDSGTSGHHPAMRRGAEWLIDRECRRPGDWSAMNSQLEPGGWFFEYHNGFYPDVDDTAMVLTALAKTGHAYADAVGATVPAVERGIAWLAGMQNSDGGWAAFDRDINKEVLTKVPFADHNAMLDPSCPDITARALEALGHYGYRPGHPQVDKALAFLRLKQELFGAWLGRWGVNYIYGTWQVLTGLRSIGFDMQDPMVRSAVDWLKQVQQPSGGWGETCRSYDDPALAGQGAPTASQTAWALLALLAAGEEQSQAVDAGIDFLRSHQRPDGTWREDQFTGTGFPKVFYLKYHMYSLYFPLMALARHAAAVKALPSRQAVAG